MEQTLRTKYQNAYRTIMTWIKENTPVDSDFGTISGIHDVYVRNEIILNKNMLSIGRSSWGWQNDAIITGNKFKWLHYTFTVSNNGIVNSDNTNAQWTYDTMIKTFVDDWKSHYKPIIEDKINMYDSLDCFEA